MGISHFLPYDFSSLGISSCWKALLPEKWKWKPLENSFILFADTRHNYLEGNKAPRIGPRWPMWECN